MANRDDVVSPGASEGDVNPDAEVRAELDATRAALALAEGALRSSEERFSAVIGAVQESVAVLVPVPGPDGLAVDHVVEWVNAAWRRRFGFEERDPRGVRVFEINPAFRTLLPLHRKVLAGGAPERVDVPLGGGRWIEAEFSRFGDRLVAVARDITERRATELAIAEGKRDLAEAQRVAKMGSWRFDVNTRAVTWSAGIYRLHGLEPHPDGVTYDGYRRFMSPTDFDVLDAFVRRLLAQGTPYEHAYDVTLDDGSKRRFVSRGEAVRDRDGRIVGARGTVADITDLREMHERIAQAQRAEFVGRLAGGVAHDYNNILAAISLNAELMREALPEDSPLRDDVMGIIDAAERAAGLTRRLLAYGRRQVLQPAVVVASELVGGMLPLIRSVCGESITVTVRQPEEPLRFSADRTAIEQAVMNLVVNARDAMPHGGRLDITLDRVDSELDDPSPRPEATTGAFVRLRVADTGTGIAPEVLPHVFEPFYSTKSPALGSGMGLASVEGAVAQSGGAVSVESELGRGSVFTMLLPEATPSASPLSRPPAAQARRTRPPPQESSARHRRLLLVEDELVLRRYLARLLREEGFDVCDVGLPSIALAKVASGEDVCEVLLTDVLLPEMHGVELAQRIKALRPGVEVVFVSGYAPEEAFPGGGVPAGARFLAKPFTRQELIEAMARR